MKSTTVGLRYAKALLDLAIEQNVLQNVYNDMRLIDKIIKSSHDFRLFINSPVIKADKKQKIFQAVLGTLVSELTIKFVNLLCSKRREQYIDIIAEQFSLLYNAHRGVQTAIVTSAVGLDETLRSKVYKLLKDSIKSELELIEKVDANLIGGFVVRIGDTQIDSSVLKSLTNLKRKFIESN